MARLIGLVFVCLVALAALIAGSALLSAVWAGSVPLTADAGVSVMIGYKQPAESMRDVGLGMGYRPTFLNDDGFEEYSRLLFLLGGNYGSGTGALKVLARVSSIWGVDWFAGPGIMAIDEGGTYALGPVGEWRLEFDVGYNRMYFSLVSGYVWRNPFNDPGTGELVKPNPVPLEVKLGMLSQ